MASNYIIAISLDEIKIKEGGDRERDRAKKKTIPKFCSTFLSKRELIRLIRFIWDPITSTKTIKRTLMNMYRGFV